MENVVSLQTQALSIIHYPLPLKFQLIPHNHPSLRNISHFIPV